MSSKRTSRKPDRFERGDILICSLLKQGVIEELAALKELGIRRDHYINLGYDDGLLEFEDRKAVVENLVRWIRKLRPDVLLAWAPGKNYQRWHKSDHRAAAYLAADAARTAMWRLLFEGQITQEGLK